MVVSSATIDSLLKEHEQYPPPPSFTKDAWVQDDRLLKDAAKDPEAFWAKEAEAFHWIKKWTKVLDWKPPFATWFVGGQINVAQNCLDRHIDPLAELLQLRHRGGAVRIACDQQDALPFRAEHARQLPCAGGLARALQTNHHDDMGLGSTKIHGRGLPQSLDQFIVDDLDDLLPRVQCLRDFRANGTFAHACNEGLDDAEVYVRFE